ncbi:MAG: MaoC family dehydratase [Lachnospiraceae bacterium]|nr:MaoC family dehydratase [Lachnospiraceae bacterium]
MNEYKMSDLAVGMTESFTRRITPEMMEKFYEISGDGNPLHREEEFARAKGFDGRVVYGMLTASLISMLGGVYLPGKYCLIQGVETKFLRPVFIGDELTVTGEVADVRPELKYLEIKVTIRNQRQEKVVRGVLKAGVMDGE